MNKIYIFFNFSKKGKGGGGNQFLTYYKDELKKSNSYTQNLHDASAILVNLNPLNFRFDRLLEFFKIILSNKKIILRVDGKLQLYREKGYLFDYACERFLFPLADGIIFQSKWAYSLFEGVNIPHKVILNEANLNIYNKHIFRFHRNNKLKIIFSSWSKSQLKGYDFIDYLIKELDEKKFHFTLIGQKKLPYKNKNITLLKPMNQNELSKEFENHDLFIFPSRNETCSNALLEAKAKGIPILAIEDAGNIEIIREKHNLFTTKKDLKNKVIDVFENYDVYNNFNDSDEKHVMLDYNKFIKSVCKIQISFLMKFKGLLYFTLIKFLFRIRKQKTMYQLFKKYL